MNSSRASRTRSRLRRSASLAAVMVGVLATPAQAQLARIRGGFSPTPSAAAGTIIPGTPTRSTSMREALAAQKTAIQQAADIRAYVTTARQAAGAIRTGATNGISVNGLYPVLNIRQAMAAAAGGDTTTSAALLVAARAANDPTGKATWDGAGLPTETAGGGNTTVDIVQNQARAFLSWDSFNIGANTTLNFSQKVGGVAQPGWIAVNRVVDSVDPTLILGKLNADGQVYVLNNAGVIFGKGSQTNLRSLVASSLELGNYAPTTNGVSSTTTVSTLQQRTLSFLQNGPLSDTVNGKLSQTTPPVPPLLLSPLVESGTFNTQAGTERRRLPKTEGNVIVDAGATITAGTGGSIILAGPLVQNAGILSATEGQVSLVGGRLIAFKQLTGEATSVDPDVRGLYLRSVSSFDVDPSLPVDPLRDGGRVINSGLIESKRGYLSLVASETGTVVNDGLLAATTSVSRNGKIALYGGSVTLGGGTAGQAGSITILPDETGETIPQGSAAEPASFKRSVIEIGAIVPVTNGSQTDPFGVRAATNFTMGSNAFVYAPNARFIAADAPGATGAPFGLSVTIGQGATIDVGGLKDVAVDSARNFVTVTPVKRNELRDTPNYREVAIGDNFTLNGTTLTVDIRRSGVRADGVHWIGSPLIEAGSIASQIPVTVSELMTAGGDVQLAGFAQNAPGLTLASGAKIDISGGWVSYGGGTVGTSKLVTSDGRIVDIGSADPNDTFTAVYSGFNETQPRFGVNNVYANPIVASASYEGAYDEGRDAGSLLISANTSIVSGSVVANAFAGDRQVATAIRPSVASTIAGDPRKLQGSRTELPSGGFVSIDAGTAAGADFVVYHGAPGATQADLAQTLLNDDMLSNAGISALTLKTSGAVTFGGAVASSLNLFLAEGTAASDVVSLTGASKLTLAPGGTLTVVAGRTIRFDGTVSAPSGVVSARTYADTQPGAIDVQTLGGGRRPDDDISILYAVGSALPKPFDITVNGTISTAGLWVNEILDAGSTFGRAWINGGSVSLTTAPKVLVALGPSLRTAQSAGDLSGSIDINQGASIDVSAGGFARLDQSFDLTGRGGNVALVNATIYAANALTRRNDVVGSTNDAFGDAPLYGENQSVGFSPLGPNATYSQSLLPSLVPNPEDVRSHVSIADGSITAFGFTGSGTFTLVSPDITFGSDARRANATHIGLDFIAKTGFGGVDLTSFRSRIVPRLFSNGTSYNSAFLDTTSLIIRPGETLDLTQTLYPFITARRDVDQLLTLATGGDLRSLSALTPVVPNVDFDRVPVSFKVGGLTELVVRQGGGITGSAGASITAAKLVNEGSIVLPGGAINQFYQLDSQNLKGRTIAVRDLSEVFGAADGNGQFSESRTNANGVSNAGLFTTVGADRYLTFLGVADENVGIELRTGSLTDLSGTVLLDPRARFINDPLTGTLRQARTGRIIAGGSIATASSVTDDPQSAQSIILRPESRTLVAQQGARIDISGTTAVLEQFVAGQGYVANAEWSVAGSIRAAGGGSLAGASVNAFGGYADDAGRFAATGVIDTTLARPEAVGGTLEWLRPTLRQSNPGTPTSNTLFATDITAQGFDTLIARNGLVFGGAVNLALDKALFVTSNATYSGGLNPGDSYFVSALNGATATVSAPYIAFKSLANRATTATNSALAIAAPATPATIDFRATLGIDFFGSNYFDKSIGTLSFTTPGDIRFIGVDGRPLTSQNVPTLSGEFGSSADTLFDAGRVYATTGTGNLQAFLDAQARGTAVSPAFLPYLVSAAGDHMLTIGGTSINRNAPLSAGSYLQIAAAKIVQNGHLAAPMGRLELGSNTADIIGRFAATRSLTFGDGSLTTLSGAGVSVGGVTTQVPYGTTLDLIEYYFSPLAQTPLKAIPNSLLSLSAGTIDVGTGATLDLKGGGGIFAYEFVSGVGGSRDVLDRFNTDTFSSNQYDAAAGSGFQYPDGRQVYTIIPAAEFNRIAPYDPVYSANYGAASPSDLYGGSAGLSVRLDGSEGIPAGNYVLLPGHYALLPGVTAYRLVENVGSAAPAAGSGSMLLDGSLIIGGTYGFAGTNLSDSTRRSFTIQSKAVFSRASRIETTSGSAAITAAATRADVLRPRLPLDAARLIISPLLQLKSSGFFDTASPAGGRGVQVDIGGTNIVVAPELTGGLPTASTPGSLTLFDSTLKTLNADSLFIGGFRVDNADGTTDLRISVNTLSILGGTDLAAPELILATGNGTVGASSLVIADNATVRATGSLADPTTAAYVVPSYLTRPTGFVGDVSGAGSVVRIANGPERLVKRIGDSAPAETLSTATLTIGAASISGRSVAFDTSRNFTISDTATLNASNLALIGDSIAFDGVFITPRLLATLEAVDQLTLKSSNAITIADGTYSFNALVIDAPALRAINSIRQTEPTNVVIQADSLIWSNSAAALGPCVQVSCGRADIGNIKPVETLSISADTIAFGSGQIRTLGFRDDVTLTAQRGIFYEGIGGLDVGLARLTMNTPFIADRAAVADPRDQKIRPDYAFTSTNLISVDGSAFGGSTPLAAISGNRAPGARLSFGTSAAKVLVDRDVLDIVINNATLLASAGAIDLKSERDLSVTGDTILATPGFTKTFGDALDSVTVAASGGSINLLAPASISLAASSTLISDTGVGNAGSINLLSPGGAITLNAGINPGLAGQRLGNFTFDSGTSAFDLGGFLDTSARLFGGDVAIRSGAGDLAVGTAQTLKAASVNLTADGGKVIVNGTIDTSGVNVANLSLADASKARVAGGDVGLFGRDGVEIAAADGSTARIDTHTIGYAALDARSARAGDVTIGIGAGTGAAIIIGNGAVIDTSANRTQAAIAAGLTKDTGRFVADTAKEPGTLADRTVYRFVEADKGGTVTLRAPLIGTNLDTVDIRLSSTDVFVGADRLQVAGVRTYDLNALSGSVGISDGANAGDIILDPGAGYDGSALFQENLLSSDFVDGNGVQSISNFIRNFSVSAADGRTSLSGFELRPGVDLVATGAISLNSNWNLAAAEIDQSAAFAAGLLDTIAPLGLRGDGTPYYSLKTGAEAALLEGVAGTGYAGANFFYRVGGKASGEAPLIAFRAGGNVTISRSINDGFFVFRDKSDPVYTNYQMGGGIRSFSPAVSLACGTFADPSCTNVVEFGTPVSVFERNALAVRINITQAERGATDLFPTVASPLMAEANNPAALGTALNQVTGEPAGASLEFAELFPLLSTGAMRSSDFSITAGSDAALSANPFHVDVTRNASLRIWDGIPGTNGEPARVDYKLVAKREKVVLVGDDLKLAKVTLFPGSDYADYDLSDLASATEYPIDGVGPNSLGILNWGTLAQSGANGFALDPTGANALAFFAGRTFIGLPKAPTGVVAPLSQIIAFLNANKTGLLSAIATGKIKTLPTVSDAPYGFSAFAQAQVQTVVRTGEGSIHLAASSDVDLRDGPKALFRAANGQKVGATVDGAYQAGGTSVYTAGQRIGSAALTGLFADGSVGTVTPTSALLTARDEDQTKGPSVNQISNNAPVLSHNGGSVAITAGRDVLGRFDSWSEAYRRTLADFTLTGNRSDAAIVPGLVEGYIGQSSQLWRVGTVGLDTELGIAAEYFTSGVGALGGGDVTIRAGRNASDLTVALDTSIVSESLGTTKALLTFGGGNLIVRAGQDIVSGRFDIASGQATVQAGGSLTALDRSFRSSSGVGSGTFGATFRLENATVGVQATGDVTNVATYGLGASRNAGLFSPTTAFGVTALGDVSFTNARLAPPTLELASLLGSVSFVNAPFLGSFLPDVFTTLYPSRIGQLSILSSGDIGNFAIAMLDLDPSSLRQSAFTSIADSNAVSDDGLDGGQFPGANPSVSEAERRLQHNNLITHLGDTQPVRIFTDGSITNTSINLAKQASVIAGRDIVDTYFVGQNVNVGDQTRIVAGRDIIASQSSASNFVNGRLTVLPYFGASGYYLGGGGTFSVSAGRDIGPFITSATLPDGTSYGGGIITVGNEYNPWLASKGADLNVLFGVAPGVDYATLRETYLNPALSGQLDGDLFVQVADSQGNLRPDRTRPVYAPILAQWLRDNAPEAFAAIFGSGSFPNDPVGNAALTVAAYGQAQGLYDAFASLDAKAQTPFLINKLYFNELQQASLPTSPSFQQYIRGYRAVEALFPTRLGYTDNLAPYTTDPATVNADHPLGVPRRNIVDGQPEVAKRVSTGNADLRFATLQTARGGDITILGPGGDFLAGSVVRTSEQPRRRFTRFIADDGRAIPQNIELGGIGPFGPQANNFTSRIRSIPLGYEGILTLRTGAVRYFSDGDLRLNQSRLFTNAVGDITAWSSNGDLNAGQGPKSAANFPPITVRFDLNGYPTVDTAGGISGAGIGAFKQTPTDPDSRIILIAPVGEVDAGDAGVRATGDVFVAAARVANADNFSAGGTLSGVPSSAIAAAPAVPPGAGSALQANLANVRDTSANKDRESVISVDILGFAGGDRCLDPNNTDANCPK